MNQYLNNICISQANPSCDTKYSNNITPGQGHNYIIGIGCYNNFDSSTSNIYNINLYLNSDSYPRFGALNVTFNNQHQIVQISSSPQMNIICNNLVQISISTILSELPFQALLQFNNGKLTNITAKYGDIPYQSLNCYSRSNYENFNDLSVYKPNKFHSKNTKLNDKSKVKRGKKSN